MRRSFKLSSHHPTPVRLLAIVVSAFLLQWQIPARAQSSPAERELEETTIIGKHHALREIPGSAHTVDAGDIERFRYSDIHQLLRQVPGLNMREEEGYGLRPNIGIRGSATERSERITLMEDGVLIAPAPYAAPAAYYFPTAGRMSGIEVLKGPASITHGPYTVGGALNLLSTPIPEQQSGAVKNELGDQGIWRTHAWYGTAEEQWAGLIETHLHRADGFKDIDRAPDDTGFDRQDYLAKLRYSWETPGLQQSLQLKFQHSEEDSDQSYLGLTNADFSADPDRRYAPSQNDNFDAEHDQLMLGWSARHESGLEWNLTAYRNDFERKWYKTEGYYTRRAGADGSFGTDDDPSLSRQSWSSLIGDLNGSSIPDELRVEFQGVLDGENIMDFGTTTSKYIGLRGNNREYFSEGAQFRVQWQIETDTAVHLLQVGVRQHRDEEDRFQPERFYDMRAGQLVEDEDLLRINANRIQGAEATAIWVRDEIRMGDWILTPGLRYENVRQRREDWGGGTWMSQSAARAMPSRVRKNRTEVLLPGLGITRLVNPGLVVFVGVHEGFAPAGNQTGAEEESSLNYELGARLGNDESDWALNLTAFYNDYSNLLGSCTASIGANCNVGDTFNAGEVDINGVEVDGRISLPHGLQAEFNLTYTDAEFKSSFDSNDFFGKVENGDPLPYTPRKQGWVGLGWQGAVRGKESGLQLAATYVDNTCVTASCNDRTDSLFGVDLKASVDVYPGVQLYAKATNLFDKRTIVARRPYGARPNQPRTLLLGVNFDF